jgi:hypothetical protein
LNLTTQAILTDVSWGLTAVLLLIAIRMGVRERTPFYALMVLGALVGAFAEPLYDVAMTLYFYSTHGMWTHFTAFDIPQPIWTHSGYVVLYAAPGIYIAHRIARGMMTRRTLFVWAGITLLESAAFEIVGINGGLYSYWGPHGLLRGSSIAAACSLHRSVAAAGPLRVVPMHVLHGQLRRRLAHHHRSASRAHLDANCFGGSRAKHLLRSGTGGSCRAVPAATISRRCRRS